MTMFHKASGWHKFFKGKGLYIYRSVDGVIQTSVRMTE